LVKKLVVKTSNPKTILDMMNELGTSFFCKTDQDEYRVIYFATNREVWFQGKLSPNELEKIKTESHEVTNITVDEMASEILIEED